MNQLNTRLDNWDQMTKAVTKKPWKNIVSPTYNEHSIHAGMTTTK